MKAVVISNFKALPNGTLLQRRNRCYVLQRGLDGRIVTDVDDGHWLFIRELRELGWRTAKVLFKPDRPPTTQE